MYVCLYRDGRLKRNDQIICINGQSLEGLPHTTAVKLLQSAQGVVELVVLRDLHSDPSLNSDPSPNSDPSTPRTPQDPYSSTSKSRSPESEVSAGGDTKSGWGDHTHFGKCGKCIRVFL